MDKESSNSNDLIGFSLLEEAEAEQLLISKLTNSSNKDIFNCDNSIVGLDYPDRQTLEPICINVGDLAGQPAIGKTDETVELLDISMKSLPTDLGLNASDSSSFMFINGTMGHNLTSAEINEALNATSDIADDDIITGSSVVKSVSSIAPESIAPCQTLHQLQQQEIVASQQRTQVQSELFQIPQQTIQPVNQQTNQSQQSRQQVPQQRQYQSKQQQQQPLRVEWVRPDNLSFDRNTVSEFEKTSLPEFFAGKYDRTHFHPTQYLQIRNLFLDEWEKRKPSPIRFREMIRLHRGIGNVVSFSRVCKFLTAIGAINSFEQASVGLPASKPDYEYVCITVPKEETSNTETTSADPESLSALTSSPEQKHQEQQQQPQTPFQKRSRKRKSYYLNEMSRLGIDPLKCGYNIPDSELDNVYSVFQPKKANGFGTSRTSHLSSPSSKPTGQQNAPTTHIQIQQLPPQASPQTGEVISKITSTTAISSVVPNQTSFNDQQPPSLAIETETRVSVEKLPNLMDSDNLFGDYNSVQEEAESDKSSTTQDKLNPSEKSETSHSQTETEKSTNIAQSKEFDSKKSSSLKESTATSASTTLHMQSQQPITSSTLETSLSRDSTTTLQNLSITQENSSSPELKTVPPSLSIAENTNLKKIEGKGNIELTENPSTANKIQDNNLSHDSGKSKVIFTEANSLQSLESKKLNNTKGTNSSLEPSGPVNPVINGEPLASVTNSGHSMTTRDSNSFHSFSDGDAIIKGLRTRPNPFKLVPCENYGNHTEAPFALSLSVEALAIIDVHSHCVKTEVIGLLGGLYCSKYRQLNVLTAEPCESLTSGTSDLQCEMDPVSQADALERLTKAGYHVVGWYHSHPTFVPNPSVRDLETQAKYQQLFGDGNQPFLALILNPYSSSHQNVTKNNLVSKYKCLMLNDHTSSSSQNEPRTPFAFSPSLVRKEKLFYNLTHRLEELCSRIEGKSSTLCITDKLKGKDIQYLTKLSSSLRHHFDATGLSKTESEYLLNQIKVILLNHLKGKSQGK